MSTLSTAVNSTEEDLFETAGILAASLSKQQMQLVSVYARLYAATQLQRVAQGLHAAGRHSLATEVVAKAEELKQ